MTAENKANFVVNLTGNVAQKAKSFGSAISQMGKSGSRSMGLMSSAMSTSTKVLDGFCNKFVGFAAGGGVVAAVKSVSDWQQQLTELGTRYNLTAEQSDDFLNTVYATGAAYKMPYSDVITALDKMLERTNDVSGSISNVDNIAKAIKGLGLNADEAGAHVAQLMNKGFTSDNINKLFNGVASASKIGTGDIKEQLAGMIELTKDTQWQSPEQLMQMLAIQRLSDSYLGNSADAAAAMQSFGKSIKDKQVQRVLRDNGINVYSDKDKTQFKDPVQLLLEIGNRAKFKDHNLKTVFPENLIKTTKAFADSEQQQKLLGGVKIEDGLLEEKTSKNTNTFNGALTSLTNASVKWAQQKLSEPLQDAADAINSLTSLTSSQSGKSGGFGIVTDAFEAVEAAVTPANYLLNHYKDIKNMLRGDTSGDKFDNKKEGVIVNELSSQTELAEQQAKNNTLSFYDKKNEDTHYRPILRSMSFDSNEPHLQSDALLRQANNSLSFYDEKDKDNQSRSILRSVSFDSNKQNSEKTLNDALMKLNEPKVLTEQMNLQEKELTTTKSNTAKLTQKSEIVLKIESADGLTVKTKSISAADTDIVVNTGKTYGRGGGMY